jgi:phosphatidylglycerol---prolipoprotein diacylglyceryl transferase
MAIDLAHHHAILAAGSRETYQFFVVLAMLLGGWIIRQDAGDWRLTEKQKWLLLFVAFVGAMVGSAIPAYFSGGLIERIAWMAPISPKTVMGGILVSFLFVAIFKRAFSMRYDTSDGFARGAVTIMAVGRIGCIFQHCCYGRAADWGMDFGDGVNRIPVQYIEATGLFLMLVLIHQLHVRNLFPGRRLFIVFVLYGVMRFGLEFLREPVADLYLGVGYYQWIALLIFATGVWQVLRRTHRHRLAMA